MISYKDRTYCASVLHVNNCPRRITDEERAEAKELGLPISWAYFCSEESEDTSSPTPIKVEKGKHE